jgi:hypothetical protein
MTGAKKGLAGSKIKPTFHTGGSSRHQDIPALDEFHGCLLSLATRCVLKYVLTSLFSGFAGCEISTCETAFMTGNGYVNQTLTLLLI